MSDSTPAKTGFSRVFLIEGRARPDHKPDYKSCHRLGGVSFGAGDITRIECPDPDNYGGFIEKASYQGAQERFTSELVGRYASDMKSDLLRLAKARCASDIHVHFGACTNPSDFNKYTKAQIWEDSSLGGFNTDPLGALESGEGAAVNETSPVSAKTMYEVTQLTFAERGGDAVTNPLVDVVICDNPSCGECATESDGCKKIYALAASSPGSPGTGPDVVYSVDKGVNWASAEITTLSSSQTGSGIACMGDNVVVVSHDEGALHYKDKDDLGTFGDWAEETTGFVVGGEPNDIWSVGDYAFVVGDGGYVYGTEDPSAGVVVLDAGVATTQNLSKVHAIDDEFAVAVGASNAVVYTENQTIWQAVTGPSVGVNLTAVWCKSKDEWWVGNASGDVFYTLDRGLTWTECTSLPGLAGYSDIDDICFSTASVGYISAVHTGPKGRILRTIDGGYSWVVMPDQAGTMPDNDAITAIAGCRFDANFVVGVGDKDGSDGIIVVGQ